MTPAFAVDHWIPTSPARALVLFGQSLVPQAHFAPAEIPARPRARNRCFGQPLHDGAEPLRADNIAVKFRAIQA